jgi:Lipocalin-like domain
MKKIIMTGMLAIISLVAVAQKGEIVLNSQNITATVVGKWNVVSIQPSDKVSSINYIDVKGPGFGEVGKRNDQNEIKPVISKIFAANNNVLIISDADGKRTQYTIKNLSASTMVMTDGTVTLTLQKVN